MWLDARVWQIFARNRRMFRRTVKRHAASRATALRRLGRWMNFRRCALAFVASGLLVVVVYACIRRWDWLSDGESNSATIRNLGLLIVVPLTLGLAFWRNSIARSQAETARGGLLNERFHKGAEMLAGKTTLVRIGGIHALRQIAQEDPEAYVRQVVRLLAAFVRHPAADGERRGDQEPAGDDVITALEAISACRVQNSGIRVALELKGANLRQAKFFAVSFEGADLSGADLTGAQFDDVNLSEAALEGAKLIETDLAGSEPTRPCVLTQANLRDADLTRAALMETILQDADLSGAKLVNADLTWANLRDADLTAADLTGATLSMADLRGANLAGAILEGADISGTVFGVRDPDPTEPALVQGLEQAQLDVARANLNRPPELGDAKDASSGIPLTWSPHSSSSPLEPNPPETTDA